MKNFATKIAVIAMIGIPLVSLTMDKPAKKTPTPKKTLTPKQEAAQKKLNDAVRPGGNIADILPALQDGADEYYHVYNGAHGPIFDAIRFNRVDAIREFARLHRNFNVRIDGDTPLEIAARENRPDVIRALVHGGAEVNLRDPQFGTTALHTAAYAGNVEATRALLDLGADTETRHTLDQQTADEAAVEAGHKNTAQMIIEYRNSQHARRPGLLGGFNFQS